jgi:putative inorganic carbon (hco3(-)) transporter
VVSLPVRARTLTATAAVYVLVAIAVLAVGPIGSRVYDAYALPKELAMHIAAAVAAAYLLLGTRRVRIGPVELLLAFALLWSAASAALAINRWMALRPLALSVSAALIFWSARHVGRDQARVLLRAAAAAAVLSAMAVLLEAYGAIESLAMQGRSPAGLGGNRNYAAHLAVLGVPILVHLGVTARGRAGLTATAVGLVPLAMSVTLSRSRAAWLALLAVAVAAAVAAVIARRRLPATTRRRGALLAAALAAGVAVAILAPNGLDWRERDPYRATVRDLVTHDRGTGRGRMIQYRTTAAMIAAHPVFGTGPGNWSIGYYQLARRGDPNVETSSLQPVNRLPNSDWLGLAAERGVPVTLALVAAALLLLRSSHRQGDGSGAAAAAAVVALVVVMGTFDAVLQRSEPLLVAAVALGCLAPASGAWRELRGRARTAVAGTALLLALAATADGARRYAAHLLAERGDLQALRLAPGDYRLRCAAAMQARRERDCERATRLAKEALELYPGLPRCVVVLRSCANAAGPRPR